MLQCQQTVSSWKWYTHCRLTKTANSTDINKIEDDFSVWTDALHSSSSQTPQNSSVNFSSISCKLFFTLQAVLESFSKATQLLTVTRSPFESTNKRKFLLTDLLLDSEDK